ncbi:hypothetical protein CMO88_03920 [Candidatus Woesearchaeota archaeon]|nr:hypothetical protein [Candidatus Woesearchaeota archaeon]|tara:strand:- start:471 stop:686 length:216 start_codon:yes stop_codon:yes gene_type:complete
MDITTVKLHKGTKTALDQIRSERESYDEVIRKLIERTRNKNLKKELVEGYQKIGKEELDILHEWEAASREL